MSAMVNLEIPWINIMSKMDLITSNPDGELSGARIGLRKRKNYTRYAFHWPIPNPPGLKLAGVNSGWDMN